MTDEYSQVELLAKVLEYEHALEHAAMVSAKYHPTACPDCQRLCQSALDGMNRAYFLEVAHDILGVCPVCNDTGLTYDETEQRYVPCGGLGCSTSHSTSAEGGV